MELWKIQKVSAMRDEVRELHPLLKEIFTADPSISRHEYTHGNTEMGADFVIARIDPTLNEETYCGAIVKCGDIKQDYADIRRQIDECKVERFFDGGRKKIYLSEIWIICNGSISNGAERKIHEDFKNRSLRFVDLDKLCRLVDRHAKHFWDSIPASLGAHFSATLGEMISKESQSALLPANLGEHIDQELVEATVAPKAKKTFVFKKSARFTLERAISSGRSIVIEGGMGSGKSTMFRRYIRTLCESSAFSQQRLVPVLFQYADIADKPQQTIQAQLEKLRANLDDSGITFLVFVDGLDEGHATSSSLLDVVKSITAISQSDLTVKTIVGTRPLWSIEEEVELSKVVDRYSILALSIPQIIKYLEDACKKIGVSDRIRGDLVKSNLFRTLPRTPLILALLTKIISADTKELPQTLPELYSKYMELALGRWDEGKGLSNEREYPVVIVLLGRLAKYLLDNRLTEVSADEALTNFRKYLSSREGLPSAEELFAKISRRSEILVRNHERGTISFRHKTFADYLLAQQQKERYGTSAPLTNPFEGYWLDVEYFYLGLIRDAGDRIDSLSRLHLETTREKLLKLFNFGNLMLAAFQTEYHHVEKAVYATFLETVNLFIQIRDGDDESPLRAFPEIQLFSLFCFSLQSTFEYDYFRKALESAQVGCQIDNSLSVDQRLTLSFLIDAVRAGLGESDVFTFLIEEKAQELPWLIRLAIGHVAEDAEATSAHIARFNKKMLKARRGNIGLKNYIRLLYDESLEDRRSKQMPRLKH